jgi:hypothetical protein
MMMEIIVPISSEEECSRIEKITPSLFAQYIILGYFRDETIKTSYNRAAHHH